MHDSDSPIATAADLGTQSPNVYQAVHDADGDATLVQTVLEVLGDASERPTDELGVRLYDAVDPDALNDLFEPTRNGPPRDTGHVSFPVGTFAVDVYASGRVLVRRIR